MGTDHDNDNTLLARWMSDELSQEELVTFERHPDFSKYKKIKEASNLLYLEKPVLDRKFEELLTKRNQATPKVHSLRSYTWLYAAAAIIISFGVLFYVKTQSPFTISTEIAETQEVVLPDGSQVSLNASSSISYDKEMFLKERMLTLDGEAYFMVKKGSSFTVLSEHGSVQVLGTSFNVFSREDHFSVFCDEGRVQVQRDSIKKVLIAGNSAFAKAGSPLSTSSKVQSPQWRNGTTYFTKASLKEVIAELERQFPIRVNVNNIDLERTYSGFFMHKNLSKALDQICLPMDISYTINGNNISLEGN